MGVAWKAGEKRDCSACGKPCIGAKSKHGSVGPIELEPDRNGNVLLFRDADGDLRYAVVPSALGEAKRETTEAVRAFVRENFMVLRMNHFATCPRSEEFRRSRALPNEEETAHA